METEKNMSEIYEIAKRIIPENRFDVQNQALELILKDVAATTSGDLRSFLAPLAYNNRYPDYHNCCTWWGS